MISDRPLAVFDIECYKNWFCVNFLEIGSGKRRSFEMYEGHALHRRGIISILRSHAIIGFNSANYDVPQLRLALREDSTNAILKDQNDRINLNRMKPRDCETVFKLPDIPFLDHIDLMEPAPSVLVGLKLYGARLGSRKLQDLPIEPDAWITPEQRPILVSYCFNDCEVTGDLFEHLRPQLELRAAIGKAYEIDLRSKSDPQIAETIIRHELERLKGSKIYRPELPPHYSFKYHAPDFIKFKTQPLQEIFATVCSASFGLHHTPAKTDEEGGVTVDGIRMKMSGLKIPDEIKKLRPKIGNMIYKMGIGGLHSMEKSIAHFSDDNYLLIDQDVNSYYPSIILTCNLFSKHLGIDFIKVFRGIVERRLAAKKRVGEIKKELYETKLSTRKVAELHVELVVQNTEMNLGKLASVGVFGKLGSEWSILFSPDLMIQVTMTGQLALLMLIESFELAGIHVVSANTDGVVTKCPRNLLHERARIVSEWETMTGFTMETVQYKALYSRDVNNYLAIKEDNGVKQKGAFAFAGSKGSIAEKNPASYVCIDAVIAYLTDGTPLRDTIEWCMDIRRFVRVRRVTGGATYCHEYLGKVVRWYYSTVSADCFKNNKGDKVAKSDGAVPLMELGGDFPRDMNYSYYEAEAIKMLGLIGAEYEL